MPGRSSFLSHDEPSRARLLIAVPWRQAGLIALCAIVGAVVSTTASTRHPLGAETATATGARAPVRLSVPQPTAPSLRAAAGDPSALRLDRDSGAISARNAAAQADGANAVAATPFDAGRELDEIDTALRLDPPAAGRVVGNRRGAALPGLVAGLLLGLLLAALRELRGGRMRSPREAAWALGAPVLGAIPTLSAKARDACVSGPVPLDGLLERE